MLVWDRMERNDSWDYAELLGWRPNHEAAPEGVKCAAVGSHSPNARAPVLLTPCHSEPGARAPVGRESRGWPLGALPAAGGYEQSLGAAPSVLPTVRDRD
jgi:hypothetical protein